ncbi:hypothetical protein [Paenibacillus sp. PCH8]|uniref:hypothetical protein n=1 Tax=Paenibacillus sp. PCH8 TaxID=2066524 RepID=UPI001C61637B|nr:hypothetical protein [Paenibacillus sp. PCH8]
MESSQLTSSANHPYTRSLMASVLSVREMEHQMQAQKQEKKQEQEQVLRKILSG